MFQERHIKAKGYTPALLRLMCHTKGRETVLVSTASAGTPLQDLKTESTQSTMKGCEKREHDTIQEKSKESKTKITEKVKLNLTI